MRRNNSALKNRGIIPKKVNEKAQPKDSTPLGRARGATNQAKVTASDPASPVAVARRWVGKSSPIIGILTASEPYKNMIVMPKPIRSVWLGSARHTV